MGISVLGPLTLDDSAPRLGPRDTVVLAALAAAGDEALSADELAEAVWGDTPPASWHKNLQSCVVRLRKVLGAGAIETTGTGYRLTLPADAVDAAPVRGARRARPRAARARRTGPGGVRARPGAGPVARSPVHRARGVGARQPGSGPALGAPSRRPGVVARGIRPGRPPPRRARPGAGPGQRGAAAGAPVGAARPRPVPSRPSGRGAAHHRRRYAAAWSTSSGIDPGPGLGELEGAILRQDPDLDVASVRQQPSEACPYLGLLPYDVEDDEGFFGRDRDIRLCRERLDGKASSPSSARPGAGSPPGARRHRRRTPPRRPAQRRHHPRPAPRRRPAHHPDPAGKPRLLVVDQAEELFSLCDDQEEQDRFVQLLADHAEAAPLVLVLRADRMGDVSAHPVLARLVERGLYVLAAMTADELRAAIEGPARQAGLIIEPGLVDLLVREVENEPGALPLLSHALRETWLRREGRTLTVAGYQASGGIRGAVAQSAESLYGELEPDQRRSLHDLLLRLVSPGHRGRAGARASAAPPGRDRTRTGRARRPARADPAGHQRRRRRRDRPRGPRPRLAATPRLARGRRRRTTDPAPPQRHRGHLGLARPPAQRALPGHPPGPGPGVAGRGRTRS